MSEAERVRLLSSAIAEAYVANVQFEQSGNANNAVIQNQIMSVVCGDAKDSCSACVKAYVPRLEEKGYYCNNRGCPGDAIVNDIRRGQCKDSCVCTIEAFQKSNAVIERKAQIFEGDISKIASDARSIVREVYPDFSINLTDIETIIRNQSSQFINQIFSSSQEIVLDGLGTFRNVRQSTAVNAVMSAIQTNNTIALQGIVTNYVDVIKPIIEAKVKKTIGQIFMNFLGAWIAFAVVIIVFALITAGLWIAKLRPRV